MKQGNKFSATAPLAGYMFQCRFALLRGLQMAKSKPNGQISIEKFDDISFENENVVECLMQAKHHVHSKNLDNKSVDFWKTLRIWSEQAKADPLFFQSARFALITTATAPEGSAAAKLRPGVSKAQREEAKALLIDAAKTSNNQSTKIARETFLDLSDDEQIALLSSIDIFDKSPNLVDMVDELEGELRILSPKHVGLLIQYLEGWWLNVVAQRLLGTEGATIPVQNIVIKAHEIGAMFAADQLPIDDPEKIGAKEYSESDEDALFVKQMRRVKLSDSVVRRGVRDYYRASAQRSKWARENLLLDGETDKYDETLKDAWGRQFEGEMAFHVPETENEKQAFGRQLCVWATQYQRSFRNVVEMWISAGSFHGLADRLEIGWHPDFESIFKVTESEDAVD